MFVLPFPFSPPTYLPARPWSSVQHNSLCVHDDIYTTKARNHITWAMSRTCCRWRIKMITISERKYFSVSSPDYQHHLSTRLSASSWLAGPRTAIMVLVIAFCAHLGGCGCCCGKIYSHFVHTLAFNLMIVLRNPTVIDLGFPLSLSLSVIDRLNTVYRMIGIDV